MKGKTIATLDPFNTKTVNTSVYNQNPLCLNIIQVLVSETFELTLNDV